MGIGINWLRKIESQLNEKSLHDLITIHFLICSVGLVVVLMYVASLLGQVFHLPSSLYANLNTWVGTPSVTGKTTSLLQYVLPVMGVFAYYPLYILLTPILLRAGEKFDKDRFPKIEAYFFAILVVDTGLLLANKEKMVLLGGLSAVWLLLFLWFPLSIWRNRWITIRMPKWLLPVILAVAIIQYILIFVPLIVKPVLIGNDYLNISEKTILASGEVVDNLDFINEHNLLGMKLYDPRKTSGFADNHKIADQNTETKADRERLSTEEEDFFDKNRIKLNTGEMKGWFFYHHNYNFGPMYALSQGAMPDKQTMVYGWLSTVTQGKLLESLGMMNYQGYFKEYFSVYLVYFALFLTGIWLIFKRLDTVVFGAVLAVSATLQLGTELIKLAPGFNPARHIFDIPVFYLLYRYLLQDRKAYLLIACGLALFAILWNKDFGLFLSLSVGCAMLFKGVKQRPYQQFPLIIGIVMVVAGMVLYFYPMPGANPTALYMLMGAGSPLAENKDIFRLLIVVWALLTATVFLKQTAPHKILTVGFAFYFVLSLTYFIWYPKSHHILGIAPVLILWLVALYHGWVSNTQGEAGIAKRQLWVFVPLLLIYIAASANFVKYQRSYNETFKNHQLYSWQFENVSITSTMDPELFEGAAKLIEQYSPNNKGIYIISKYDHILPVLAGKYSAMPYNELLTNLVSPKEVEVAAKAISAGKPGVLFVDSDIGRAVDINSRLQFDNGVVHLHDLFGSVIFREGNILSPLGLVFENVEDRYIKCGAGKVISVYCLKPE